MPQCGVEYRKTRLAGLGLGLVLLRRAPTTWLQVALAGRARCTGGSGGGVAGMPLLLRTAQKAGLGGGVTTERLQADAELRSCVWVARALCELQGMAYSTHWSSRGCQKRTASVTHEPGISRVPHLGLGVAAGC